MPAVTRKADTPQGMETVSHLFKERREAFPCWMHLGFPLAAKRITSGYRAELVWGESLRTGHWGGTRVLEKDKGSGERRGCGNAMSPAARRGRCSLQPAVNEWHTRKFSGLPQHQAAARSLRTAALLFGKQAWCGSLPTRLSEHRAQCNSSHRRLLCTSQEKQA